MPISPRTKAVAALGALDITRQLVTAWTARREAERDRLAFGQGLRTDARHALHGARVHARGVRNHVADLPWVPLHREPTASERLRAWAPIAAVVVASTASVVVAARYVARHDASLADDEVVTNSKVVGAVRASSQAIDAGVSKVADGGTGVAVGTASAIAAGSSAVQHAVVDRAKEEVDERVVQPAKQKAITFGAIGIAALTAYVVVIAAVVQLIVGAIG